MNPFLTLKVIFVCLFLFWWGFIFCRGWDKDRGECTTLEALAGITTFIAHIIAFGMIIGNTIKIFVIAYHAAPQ